MSKETQPTAAELELLVHCEVVRQIRQHCRSSMKAEVCGVLIGTEEDGKTTIQACIAGASAVQAGTHVTFTQDTWEHIYKVKDREYPELRIVGWYHSHPGFGVFLSDHDTFIHQNFFLSPQQVAWVYDPHSEEEGCFAWKEKRLERLSKFSLVDEKGGEQAGETGKPEVQIGDMRPAESAGVSNTGEKHRGSVDFRAATRILSFLSIFVLGALASWYFFPRPVFVLIDPRMGATVMSQQDVERLLSRNPAAAGLQERQGKNDQW
jgi:proteasome lid subunit RPN8/RPN11